MNIDAIFYILILIMSIVIHEISHGFMAERFGDHTARYAGRLTLNPLKHLDPLGSVILPAFLVFVQAPFLFGWAKPVPYNPDNLRNRKWGTIAVASAGVLANFFIAIIFGMIVRVSVAWHLSPELVSITALIVLMNLALGIFNLVPIPPLDGSKIIFSLLPQSFYRFSLYIERYSFLLFLTFVFFFSQYLSPVLSYFFVLITGLKL